MSGARARAIAAGIVAAVLLVAGAGTGWADPSTDPSAPPASGAPTSDPAAPPAEDSTGGTGEEIKSGTPKQGTIHWEQFGGDRSDAPKDLESFSDMMVGYALTGFGIAAVVGGLIVCAAMMAGFRGRSQVARLALEQSIWLYVAAMIVGSFSSLGGMLIAGAL